MSHELNVAHLVGGVTVLLLLAAVIHVATKRWRLPFAVVLVPVGVLLTLLADVSPLSAFDFQALRISPDIILYVFLPSLIFESAYNMDVRRLRENLGPVLLLAVPGLLLSTLVIGLIVWAATPFPFTASLLLGAILSATDPVAVVSLFRRLGAPARLSVLVEGESLFNDATSIVVARIILGVLVGGSVTAQTIGWGVFDFFVVFVGGLAVGTLLGLLTGVVIGKVADSLVEITLTTVLAYASFFIAEQALGVSGVMATIGAGLTLGGWGRMKVSHGVRDYLDHFWEYVAFVATALIFLMVGLRVDLSALWGTGSLLAWVVVAMLVSRAVVVYGLMPFVGQLTRSKPVDQAYRAVIYWGGLRGAIALAIVLSLPHFELADTFVALVMGAVLFTLLIQGLSIESLVRRLGLDRPAAATQLVELGASLTAKQDALRRLPELAEGGHFSSAVAERLRAQSTDRIMAVRAEIERLHIQELDRDAHRTLLYLRAFAEENSRYVDMFNQHQLSERAYRKLTAALNSRAETVRTTADIDRSELARRQAPGIGIMAVRMLGRVKLLASTAERMRLSRVALDYELAWGEFQVTRHVLSRLEDLVRVESTPWHISDSVRQWYEDLRERSGRQLDQIAEQFPEFVSDFQERVGYRLLLMAETDAVAEQATRGTLPGGAAERLREQIREELNAVGPYALAKLKVEPLELLDNVPFLAALPIADRSDIAVRLRVVTATANEPIIRQGEPGHAMFLIARGVARVSRVDMGVSKDLATLVAGDFFGESAILTGEARNATVTAVTPCVLYSLRGDDLRVAIALHPDIREALEQEVTRRKGNAVIAGIDQPRASQA